MRTPPRGVPRNRDVYVEKHDAVPEEFGEEPATGRIGGPELARIRSRRPTPERLSRLEDKHDKLDEKVDAIHGDIREMRGEWKTAMAFIADQGKTERTRIGANAKIWVAAFGAAGAVFGAIYGIMQAAS